MKFYDFIANDINGTPISMQDYKGKVLLVVNTASQCGFTPQYEDLQRIYDQYKESGLEILAFPCNQFEGQEPGSNADIKAFCTGGFGVNFPLFEKIDTNGKLAHPIYKFLKEEAPFDGLDLTHPTNKILNAILNDKFPEFTIGKEIRWNFTKFLVDKQGNVVQRFESAVSPTDMVSEIETLLK
jgi:glutathione peroxidase